MSTTDLCAHQTLHQVRAPDLHLIFRYLMLVNAHDEVTAQNGLLLELAVLVRADGWFDERLAGEVFGCVQFWREVEVGWR